MGGHWPFHFKWLLLYFGLLHTQFGYSSLLHSRRPSASSLSKQCDRPCFNGGTCLDGVCVCAPGWTGPQCDSCFNRIVKNSTSGYITDGPLNYSASSRCTWIIESGTSKALVLKLEDFFTECCWDHFYVYDGRQVGDNLIAAFSGNLTGIEVMASSGTAIVYFTSDLAFNLRGFNVSYAYDKCLYGCNNNGVCENGVCKCKSGFAGDACETPKCELNNNDQKPCVRSDCVSGKCQCSTFTQGDLCQGLTTEPVWDRVPLSLDELASFHSRASHQVVVNEEDNKVWIYGGYQLNRQNSADLLTYDPINSKFEAVQKDWANKPDPRYDHSMVIYNNALYVFGGVVNQSYITNELWRFDLKSQEWSLESSHNASFNALPSAVAGHTAHVIKNEMYIVFGYNPYEGYLHRVQIYSFATKTWSKPDERGGTDTQVLGRFGHASVLADQEGKNPFIFVYGGFNAPLNSYSYSITDDLLMYDTNADTWTTLESPGKPRFRHSAVSINGIMLIFGGNSHNESTAQQAGCYSSSLIAYDTVCKNWMKIEANVDKVKHISRFGHAAVSAFDSADKKFKKMFVFGGFSGIARHDVIKLTPTSACDIDNKIHSTKECVEESNGIRCVLNDGKKCEPASINLSYRQPFSEFIKSDNPKLQSGCYATDSRFVEETTCDDVKDCEECVGRKRCGWCSTSHSCISAGSGCVDDLFSDRRSCNSIMKKSEKQVTERACGLATNCYACRRMSHCVWLTVDTKRVCVSKSDHALILEQHNRRQAAERLHYDDLSAHHHIPLLSSRLSSNGPSINGNSWNPYREFHSAFDPISVFNSTAEQCPEACANLDKCFDCIRAQCMWCPTVRRCVPMDTYMISFPYGQCQSWVTAANTPHSCEMDPLDCKLQKTCTECQLVGPQCGWCDKGSGTGLGECMSASIDGPLDKEQCKAERNETWFYVGEPSCQCNGHATCKQDSQGLIPTISPVDPLQQCSACTNSSNTKGEHCELCIDGYFGDARNGGACKKCSCNDQATLCDPETGYCYCSIKGTAGRHCDHCEPKYDGNPKEGKPCTFELGIDFIFTFKLDSEDFKDKYVRQINFYSRPYKPETDVQFTVTCESESGANVTINLTSNVFDQHPGPHSRLSPALDCNPNGIKRVYSASDFEFGTDMNTTFYVKITDFVTPIKIQISFAQTPPINWVLFFVIFAACFIVLLVVAGILLLIKQRIRNAGNEANVIIENERMAKRPKAIIKVDVPITKQNTQPTAISVEPCRNFNTAIYTVIVRLPTGNKRYTPFGASGLAFASTLCHLSQAQVALLEPPNANEKETNQKRNFKRFIPFIRRS
ncbi:hypothetical protein M3Y97_00907400 [Aphelenchoides bicaudatus]|nr:hypothetical protein M3Y97_00907400 [Aphelenchoides bicaudatus]